MKPIIVSTRTRNLYVDMTNLPTAEGLRQFQAEQDARLRAVVARGEAVRAELAATELSAKSADGAVTATVGAGGVLKDLSFGAKASGMTPVQLRASIMAAYRAACGKAAERSVAAISKLVGEDDPSLRMLRDAVPPPPADDEEPSR